MPKRHRGRPEGQTGQAPILKPEEIKRLFRMAKSRPRMSMKAEIALCMSLYLGLRAKEIAALRSGDVYDENGAVRDVLHLKSAYTKGSKTRNVFLAAPKLRQHLAEYGRTTGIAERPQAPLCRSQKGGTFRAGSMARFLKRLYMEAGIPEGSSHTGRRTFITSLAERGIDLKAIAVLAGHSNIRTTALYVDASPLKLSRILSDVAW
jgi:integrase/recombinase XerD